MTGVARGGYWRWELLIAGLVFIATFVGYSFDTNDTAFRDEDYQLASRIALILELLNPIEPSTGLISEILFRLKIFVVHTVFYYHGSAPFVPGAVVYLLADVLGVPFTYSTMVLPSTLSASAAAAVAFYLARAIGADRVLAIMMALALAASPILAGVARGIGTYGWVWIVLSHLVFMWMFVRHCRSGDDGRDRSFGLAAATLLLMFSDSIYYLLIAAAIAALLLRNADTLSFASVIANGKRLLQARAFLVVLVVGTSVHVGALLAYPYVPENIRAPLFAATGRHELALMVPSLPQMISTMSLLYGELTALLLACWLCLAFRRREMASPLFLFAVFSVFGYGALFMILSDPSEWALIITYQSYLLAPLFLLAVWGLSGPEGPVEKTLSMGKRSVAAVTLVSSLLGTGAYLWDTPTTMTRAEFDAETWGASRPETGAKAAGYLIRTFLLECCDDFNARTVTLTVARNENILGSVDREDSRYFNMTALSGPLQMYAGTQNDGYQIARYAGSRPSINLVEIDGGGTGNLPAGMSCEAPYCVQVDVSGGDMTPPSRFRIVGSDGNLVDLLLPAETVKGIPSGEVSAEDLKSRFDLEFAKLSDFFPGVYDR